jgi:hypothetical protein
MSSTVTLVASSTPELVAERVGSLKLKVADEEVRFAVLLRFDASKSPNSS